jgi:sugar/nucleoside kinase (ribokinase family)
VPELFRKMKEAGLTTSLDTNDDPEDKWDGVLETLKYVDVFLPNEREAPKVAGTNDVESAIRKLAELVPVVVVKMGREGAMAQRGQKRLVGRSRAVESVDAVGAGDSFDAGFLHEYVRGSDLETCLGSGNLAGAFSTTRAGGIEAFRDAEWRANFFKQHS